MNLDETKRRIFRDNQDRLPVDERSAVSEDNMCMMESSNGFSCTCEAMHKGDHIAHGSLGTVIYRWPRCADTSCRMHG